jgi:lysophospholipase L1-like esterase
VRASSSQEQGRLKRVVAILDFALVLALAVALLAWLFDPFRLTLGPARLTVGWGLKPLVVPFALLLARIAAGRSLPLPRRSGLSRVALALAAVLLPLAAIDGALALAGVKPGEAVFVVRGEGGEAVRADGSMVSDAVLLWKFQPGVDFNGRRVNKHGFLDREIDAKKAPGVRRIICMGDSCTAQGAPTYAGHLNRLLQENPPGPGSWEAFNTGVHGYTVLQGLALFRERVGGFEPDIVTIYFGWNDHWLAEDTDAERMARAGSAWQTALRNALAKKRLRAWLAPSPDREPGATRLRVAPDEYHRGLADLIGEIRAAGATPLVLAAPRAATIHRGIVHGGHARSVDEAISLHDQYLAIAREVAAREDARVLDLADIMDGEDDRGSFSKDGIHLTDAGLQRVAELIDADVRKIAEQLQEPSEPST